MGFEIEIRQYKNKDKEAVYKLFYDGMNEVFDCGAINFKTISLIYYYVLLEVIGKFYLNAINLIGFSLFSKLINYYVFHTNFILCLLISLLLIIILWLIFFTIVIKRVHLGFLEYYYMSINSDFKDLDSWLIEGESNIWVAVYNNEIVGSIGVRDISNTEQYREQTGKVAELKRMYVSSEFGRKGIASKLYQILENWCLKYGYDTISLSTGIVQVSGINFYKKLGFKYIYTEKLPETFYPPIVFYEKRIKN